MEWLPTDRLDVVKTAVPEPSSASVARVVVPSRKLTVPVGVPLPGAAAATVAVKVTDSPKTAFLSEELSFVLVASCCTL
jgi:hypothetical protein